MIKVKVLDKEENEWLAGWSRSNMIDFPLQAEVATSSFNEEDDWDGFKGNSER